MVLLAPIISYVLGLIAIPIVMPACYLFAAAAFIIFPWLVAVATIVSSPFLAVRCPWVALRHRVSCPGNLTRSVKHGLLEPWQFFKAMKLIYPKGSKFSRGCIYNPNSTVYSWWLDRNGMVLYHTLPCVRGESGKQYTKPILSRHCTDQVIPCRIGGWIEYSRYSTVQTVGQGFF